MGKQVGFYAIGSDEDAILAYVARTGGHVVAPWSDAPTPRRLEALGREDVVYLARTDDPDEVWLREVASGWQVDLSASYVVEFRRCILGPTGGLSEGRVYAESIPSWTQHPGELAFIAWTERLLAHVRRAFPRRGQTYWRWGPEAGSRKWPIGSGELGSLPTGLIRAIVGRPLDGADVRYEPGGSAQLTPDRQRPGVPFPEWVELAWVSENLRQVVYVPLTLLGIAAGDIVRVRPIRGRQCSEIEVVERSGHATVQAAIDRAQAVDAVARLRELAQRRGWRIEMWLWSLFAVDVPPGLEIDEVVRELEAIDGVRDIVPVVV